MASRNCLVIVVANVGRAWGLGKSTGTVAAFIASPFQKYHVFRKIVLDLLKSIILVSSISEQLIFSHRRASAFRTPGGKKDAKENAMQPARPNAEIIEKEIGEYKKGQVSFEQRTGVYNDLLGFTPPRIEARFRVTGALDPTVLDLQEQLRNHAMNPKCFDTKTAKLMVFSSWI
jgi:hypothetical protein